jgi:glycosyltransferase involved in cell wall biosynthesis
MKIAIIGTRGIPNNYGGFEQFADIVSQMWVKEGHDVYVYCPHNHPYQSTEFNGVHRIVVKDPEERMGTVGQFLYDLRCIRDARKRNFDIFLQLGYTSSSVWGFLFPKKTCVITNMDGLEWKRAKYGKTVKAFLKTAERWAVKQSHAMVADSRGIQSYLQETYKKDSDFIAYGAALYNEEANSSLPTKYNSLKPYQYDLVITRFVADNNLEMILDGYLLSEQKHPLIMLGNSKNEYGLFLRSKYKNDSIIFEDPNFNMNELNELRAFSRLYFHGHSAGGTNPSLLEAMASNALLCVHNNAFNNSVIEGNGFHFENANEIANLMNKNIQKEEFTSWIEGNRNLIENKYSWNFISSCYLDLFQRMLNSK